MLALSAVPLRSQPPTHQQAARRSQLAPLQAREGIRTQWYNHVTAPRNDLPSLPHPRDLSALPWASRSRSKPRQPSRAASAPTGASPARAGSTNSDGGFEASGSDAGQGAAQAKALPPPPPKVVVPFRSGSPHRFVGRTAFCMTSSLRTRRSPSKARGSSGAVPALDAATLAAELDRAEGAVLQGSSAQIPPSVLANMRKVHFDSSRDLRVGGAPAEGSQKVTPRGGGGFVSPRTRAAQAPPAQH